MHSSRSALFSPSCWCCSFSASAFLFSGSQSRSTFPRLFHQGSRMLRNCDLTQRRKTFSERPRVNSRHKNAEFCANGTEVPRGACPACELSPKGRNTPSSTDQSTPTHPRPACAILHVTDGTSSIPEWPKRPVNRPSPVNPRHKTLNSVQTVPKYRAKCITMQHPAYLYISHAKAHS